MQALIIDEHCNRDTILTWRYHFYNIAEYEWVTCVSTSAYARRKMINYLAISILSTSSRARILTFIIKASFIGSTVTVYDTLRSTTIIRIAKVSRQAIAGPSTILFLTNAIYSAW